jgi:signal transduction histidine kinase
VRLDRVFASTSARLAAIYAALLLIAFLLAGFAVWLATRSAAEVQIRERVQSEMSALQQEIRVEGMPAAIAAIRTRMQTPGALEYRLFDENGGTLVGDLPVERPALGWSFVDLPDAETMEEGEEDLLVFSEATPSGGVLAIADDLLHAERIRSAVLSAIFWVGALALTLALAAGFLATRGALSRMDALSSALARVGAGDMATRVPERAGGDDVDAIGRSVNQMLTRIDLLVANVRRVSTDIAHDLRTPLGHVRQNLEAAAASHDLSAAHDAIAKAQAKIEDVLRIFAAMLRLAEIDSGTARSRFARVDISAVAERVADAYRPDLEACGLTLRFESDGPAHIEGDADLIAQALSNLIENALRHAGAGANVSVRLRGTDAAVRLEVQDSGVGISAEDRARAVDAFVRLDPSRSAAGAGLGLSIVAAIARLHRAELLLEDASPGLRAVLVWPTHVIGEP